MQKGYLWALSAAMISGFSVFLNKFAVASFPNSDLFTASKNFLIGLFFLFVALSFGRLVVLKNLSSKDWLKLFVFGLLGGTVPFILFFRGLSLTDASSAGLIQKTMFIFVALVGWYFLKEKFSKWQLFALAVLGFGNYLLLGAKNLSFGLGEILILLAVLFWSAEFILIKKLLPNFSVETLLFSRMFLGGVVLLGYNFLTGTLFLLPKVQASGWFWLIITAGLLLAYVSFWYRAMKYLPAGTVAAILTLASPLTTCLNYGFGSAVFRWQTFGAFVLMTFAVVFLLKKEEKINVEC